jgi:Methyltransferase FkbM domain
MDFANYQPPMLRFLVARRAFAREPFFLVDVGCAGGIDSLWRIFGDQLAGVGFDPQQSEVARLRADESNPNIEYVAALIGLGDEHEFHRRRRQGQSPKASLLHAYERSSAAALKAAAIPAQSNVLNENMTEVKMAISDYVRKRGVGRIDFIKIDTDGADFEAALSAADIIRPCGVLGFLVETPFSGSHQDTENSFHNIDRFMRQQGFMPYTMALRHYSRAALPAQFVYDIPAQTRSGQLTWADTVFLRDGASPECDKVWGGEALGAVALLKLAALYELFGVPDCAAELIVAHPERIGAIVDPDKLLDLLTPPLDGERLPYRDYIAVFRSDPRRFFPGLVSTKHMARRLAAAPRRAGQTLGRYVRNILPLRRLPIRSYYLVRRIIVAVIKRI